MASIRQELLEALHLTSIGYEMVHLSDAAILTVALALLVVVLGVLVVHLTILLALLLDHTHTSHVVVMLHHRGNQHTRCRQPKAQYV